MANTKLPARLLDTSAVPALNVTGDLTVDTNTLKVDSTNNRVGINTTSPSNALSVSGVITSGNFTSVGVGGTPGDANTAEIGPGYINLARDDTANAKQILFGKNGAVHSFLETTSSGLNIGGANVGIGETSPSFKLHVKNTNTQIAIESTTTNQNSSLYYIANGASQWETGVNITAGLDYEIYDRVNNASRMVIEHTGNVGIGTASPQRELHVHNSSSGATPTSNSVAVFEGNDNTEISILGGSSSVLAINFGHSGDNNEGLIYFNTTTGSENMQLQSTKDITYQVTSTNSTAGHHIFKSYNTEIMRIDGQHNKVGIGTDDPISILHLEGSTNSYATSPLLYFGSTSTANAAIRDWAIGPADSNYGDFHIFQGTSTGASAIGATQVKFTINASGNVGIGDRSPNSRLTVANTAAGDGTNIADFAGSDGNQRLIVANFTCGSDEDRVGLIWENQGVALWRNWMDDDGNLRLKSSNPTHDHDGKRVVTESLVTGTSGGFLEQVRVYPGNVANYTGDVEGGSNKGGTQIWIFSIQGNNTWYKVLTNMHDMAFEFYTLVGDAGSRDQASYSANMTSPAYGVSSLNQNYYHNGGWNTGSFEYRFVATPGNNAQYDLECRFTSYYSSSNVATGYIHMRRVY